MYFGNLVLKSQPNPIMMTLYFYTTSWLSLTIQNSSICLHSTHYREGNVTLALKKQEKMMKHKDKDKHVEIQITQPCSR